MGLLWVSHVTPNEIIVLQWDCCIVETRMGEPWDGTPVGLPWAYSDASCDSTESPTGMPWNIPMQGQ